MVRGRAATAQTLRRQAAVHRACAAQFEITVLDGALEQWGLLARRGGAGTLKAR